MRTVKNKIGECYTTKEGYIATIIDYKDSYNVIIKFNDKNNTIIKCQMSNLRNGSVRNPYHPSVCGVGYLGLNKDGTRPISSINNKRSREYTCWSNMISRCYANTLERNPTYKNIEVCDRWKCYANFLEDLPKIKGYDLWLKDDNYALDKDLSNCKFYSLETCEFIHCSDNSKERIIRQGKLKDNRKIKAIKNDEIILFNSILEAEQFINKKGCSSNICKCCQGERKTAYGYKWEYIDK